MVYVTTVVITAIKSFFLNINTVQGATMLRFELNTHTICMLCKINRYVLIVTPMLLGIHCV